MQYLGFIFNGQQAAIRTSSISRYLRKARKAVNLAKATQKKHNDLRSQKGMPPEPLYRKKLFEKYYHTGKSNFLRYGYRAAKILNSGSIKNQMKKMQKFLLKEISTQ